MCIDFARKEKYPDFWICFQSKNGLLVKLKPSALKIKLLFSGRKKGVGFSTFFDKLKQTQIPIRCKKKRGLLDYEKVMPVLVFERAKTKEINDYHSVHELIGLIRKFILIITLGHSSIGFLLAFY